jgi:CRISPR/Cas system-associated exonuclease Cas4 (RecB family)
MNFNHVKVNEFDKLEQVTREDGVRFYATPSGKRYPSVTTVLSAHNKQGLLEWRKKVGEEQANKISSAAAKRGTKLHLHCENYINNVDVISTMPLFQRELFESILPLLNNINNVHVQEQRLYSDHLRLAGTVDCVAEYEGKLAIIDYKTSSRRKNKEYIHNYFMQCAAYAIMYEERTGIPISKLVIIIAVENDDPQVFVEKRDNWVKKLLEYRDLYEQNYLV